MTVSIRSAILAGTPVAAMTAGAAAFAQTTTAPSGTDCPSTSAANSGTCQNQLQQPGMINNNLESPTVPQNTPPAAGVQGGSSGGLGGSSSGGSVGGSGMSGSSSSGGLGGSSGGGASSN